MELAWIVVDDLKKAVQFYTETVGLKLMTLEENFGWAELEGQEGGARLGIAQASAECKAGQNAYVTFTVENIEHAHAHAIKNGAQAIGPLQEIPGHVKLQTYADQDGNHFQLAQMLET